MFFVLPGLACFRHMLKSLKYAFFHNLGLDLQQALTYHITVDFFGCMVIKNPGKTDYFPMLIPNYFKDLNHIH